MTTNKAPNSQTFEQDMATLQALVNTLDSGDLPLEDAMKAFEQGNQLVARCRAKLAEVELKVEKIINAQGGSEPFEA
ncbi:MAG: exodeoxyribonuclease VII small subunit [Alphaproteobacteria bacterium]